MELIQDLYRYDFNIRNLAHGMRYVNDRKVAEYGLTYPQAWLLAVIYDGQRIIEAEVNRKYLEEVTLLKGPSVTSLLNGLEKNGFIQRSANAHDARNTDIELTAKGNGLIDGMKHFFAETEKLLLRGMTGEERETFLRLLEKAAANILAAGG